MQYERKNAGGKGCTGKGSKRSCEVKREISSFLWVFYLLNFHSTSNISHKYGTLTLKVALDGQF